MKWIIKLIFLNILLFSFLDNIYSLSYANWLKSQKDYHRLEIQLIKDNHNTNNLFQKLNFTLELAQLYFIQKQYPKVISFLYSRKNIKVDDLKSKKNIIAINKFHQKKYFLLGESLFYEKQFKQSITSIQKLKNKFPSSIVTWQNNITLLYQYILNNNSTKLNGLIPKLTYPHVLTSNRKSQTLLNQLYSPSIKKKTNYNFYSTYPQKSTLGAVIASSIIPGLGQLYTGRLGDAISSFLVVSSLTLISILSFQSQEYLTGTTSALLAGSFHIANIYSAYRSTTQFNTTQKEILLEKIVKLRFQLKI